MTNIDWQQIAFMMLAGWMGWLSILVFRQGDKLRILEMQIALRNGEDLNEIKAMMSKLSDKNL